MIPDQRRYEVEREEVYPLLDKYKKGWTTLYDQEKVAATKEKLRKQVEEKHEVEFPGMVKSFLHKCWHIEQRWARPSERPDPVH